MYYNSCVCNILTNYLNPNMEHCNGTCASDIQLTKYGCKTLPTVTSASGVKMNRIVCYIHLRTCIH